MDQQPERATQSHDSRLRLAVQQLRLRTRWWVLARLLLIALPIAMLGTAAGVMLYAATHSRTFTGSAVVRRPAGSARPFGWPLRLARRVNVLLIGVDVTINERRQILPVSRSDTLMLLSFDPEHTRVSVLSIPRDTYTVIPGVGPERINAAYAYGGPRLTIRAVEDLLGVPIHYYVKLGPSSFARIIDALGGIEVDVEKDMKYTDTWANLYINLTKGLQVLSGDQAMQYIRFRHDTEGDIGRVRRQQKALLAIAQKLKTPAATLSAPRLLQAFMQNTQTNLSASELTTLGLFARHVGAADIRTATPPGEVGPTYVFLYDTPLREMVAEMFLGIDAQTLSSTALEVLNGSGVPGLARETASRLERLGFRIVRVETAPQLAQTTTIIDRAGRPEVARVLAELLGQKPVTYEPGAGADITVVVARDLVVWFPVRVSQRPH